MTENFKYIDEIYQQKLSHNHIAEGPTTWNDISSKIGVQNFLKAGLYHFNFVYALVIALGIGGSAYVISEKTFQDKIFEPSKQEVLQPQIQPVSTSNIEAVEETIESENQDFSNVETEDILQKNNNTPSQSNVLVTAREKVENDKVKTDTLSYKILQNETAGDVLSKSASESGDNLKKDTIRVPLRKVVVVEKKTVVIKDTVIKESKQRKFNIFGKNE